MTGLTNTMSSNLETFHIFNNLPIDLRLMIWEITFPERTLTFTLSKYDDRAEDTPARDVSPMFAVDNSDPQGLFAVQSHVIGPGGKLINNGLPLPELLCTEKPARVMALSACRESRDFAIRVGYRPWNLKTGLRLPRWRMMIWNPRYDVVFIDEKHSAIKGQPLFILTEKFKNSFPKQAKELRSIALYTSHWNQKTPDERVMVEKWVGFESLTRIIAVMDKEYETARVTNLTGATLNLWIDQGALSGLGSGDGSTLKKPKGVVFPKDLENDLQLGKKARNKWSNWVVPTVTLTDPGRLAQGNTNGLELRLRCSPCADLHAHY
ncbi:hypothetical protein BKA65DRAFT_199445 [Rhexocercosporidium sp. MPI-PUGE-AT-0058]|nr:hypothetical protein BKA65DRAFT_199445 [Rhexocercosporidium sp. MPI-PUGE-AT-0058]